MTFRDCRSLWGVNSTLTAGLFLASCSLLPQTAVGPTQDSRVPEPVVLRKVVQLGFGLDAMFGACIEPACPTVTRKTFGTTQTIAPATELQAVEPTMDPVALQPGAASLAMQRAMANLYEVASEASGPALTLNFPLAATALTATDKGALDQLVPTVVKAERILITSRTDNVGSDSANQRAALRRAHAVRDYLTGKLPAHENAFVVDARGSCCFIASNDTPGGRRQNRRVEIVLSAPQPVAR